VVVVLGAGAAGLVAGVLVVDELEHPVNARATTARPATAVAPLTIDRFTANPLEDVMPVSLCPLVA